MSCVCLQWKALFRSLRSRLKESHHLVSPSSQKCGPQGLHVREGKALIPALKCLDQKWHKLLSLTNQACHSFYLSKTWKMLSHVSRKEQVDEPCTLNHRPLEVSDWNMQRSLLKGNRLRIKLSFISYLTHIITIVFQYFIIVLVHPHRHKFQS